MSESWAPLVVLVALCSAAAGGAELPRAETAPGTVVRWPGDEIDSCQMEGRRWEAGEGACWFAIDLLRSHGPVEVSRLRGGHEERAVIEVGDYPYPVQYITLEDDTHVDLSAADLERVRGEQQRVAKLWASGGEPRFTLPLASPVRERGIGGRFGSRRFFNDQPRSPHTGADYAVAAGEPVLSVAAGRVALADDLFFSGISVFVDHGGDLISMYFHLRESLVEAGQEVVRGQIIGRVGATGRATGPHLHFGLRWRGARIDPEQLLDSGRSVATMQ